jgi:hypothetical protein
MISVFTALYPEAEPLLSEFRRRGISMKRLPAGNLSVWRSEDGRFMLTVTGSGEIASAVTAARLLTQFPADFAVNFGTAAGRDPVTACFRIHKITEEATGRDFYPGLVWRTAFSERTLRTVPQQENSGNSDLSSLTDMEGAGFFQAAARFLSPDRILLLKVVSDAGDTSDLTAERLREICAAAAGKVTDCLAELAEAAALRAARQETGPAGSVPAFIIQAEDDLHGSEAMRLRLRRILRWQMMAGEDAEGLVRRLYEDGRLPAADKKKGKEVLEQLERDIL